MQITQIQALIDTINDNGRNTALEVRTVLSAIKNELFKLNEIKMIFMSPSDITANFDNTGLGINNSIGFAVSNGANGTQDYRRKSPIGYDSTTFVSGFNYSVVGGAFGEEKHTLTIAEMPSHTHTETKIENGTDAGGSGSFNFINSPTGSTGGDLPHNNIQPSKVTLFIQRVS